MLTGMLYKYQGPRLRREMLPCSLEIMDCYVCIALVVLFLVVIYQLVLKAYIAGGVCTSKARMDGKTVIVTGANTGIGKETALDMAKRGARVIMACRDMKKGEAAFKYIVEKTGSTKVVLKNLDLSSLKSIRKFAEDINKNEPELRVLINNAGIGYPSQLTKTEDGFEMTMGVNHFGHFLLTNLLVDLLKKSTPSRIVVVASSAHQTLGKEFKFNNINSETFYDKHDAYVQSKLANVLFARELAKRLQGTGVTANSLHPGVVLSGEFLRNMPHILVLIIKLTMSMISKTPEQGAQTSIYLAVSEDVEGVSGLYFFDCKQRETSKYAQDDGAAKKLWEVSADLVGLDTTI